MLILKAIKLHLKAIKSRHKTGLDMTIFDKRLQGHHFPDLQHGGEPKQNRKCLRRVPYHGSVQSSKDGID